MPILDNNLKNIVIEYGLFIQKTHFFIIIFFNQIAFIFVRKIINFTL